MSCRRRSAEWRTVVHAEVARRGQWYDLRAGHSDAERCRPDGRGRETVGGVVERADGQVDVTALGRGARRYHTQRRTLRCVSH